MTKKRSKQTNTKKPSKEQKVQSKEVLKDKDADKDSGDEEKDAEQENNNQSQEHKKGKAPAKKKHQIPQAIILLDYWHGMLPNEDTAGLVKNDGEFLLRTYIQEDAEPGLDQAIVLSVRWGPVVKNVIIKDDETGFTVNDLKFKNMQNLIDNFQIRKRPLNIGGTDVVLENPVRRRPWELRHRMIQLGKELGTGSYGIVFKGQLTRDRQKPIEVAVKVLSEMSSEASNALWKEARVMQLYDHLHVVKLYGVCNDLEPYYLVMEFVSGGSVDSFLTKKGKGANVVKRIQILLEAATGLDYLHSRGCIHRDIACRNLLISNVVKVADFGLTRKSKSYKIDPDKPMNLRWIAPDVFTSEIVDKKTDIYAFGVTMYEAFTNPYSIPYANWNAQEVYDRVVEKGFRLSPPPMMPSAVGELMDECLGPPESRPDFKTLMICLREIHKNPNKKLGHNL